jgi:hypothetical protein
MQIRYDYWPSGQVAAEFRTYPSGEQILREYGQAGNLQLEMHYLHDVLHCENGPAFRIWYGPDQLQREIYYLHGKMHRAGDLPAFRMWLRSGKLIRECQYVDDCLIHSKDYD